MSISAVNNVTLVAMIFLIDIDILSIIYVYNTMIAN